VLRCDHKNDYFFKQILLSSRQHRSLHTQRAEIFLRDLHQERRLWWISYTLVEIHRRIYIFRMVNHVDTYNIHAHSLMMMMKKSIQSTFSGNSNLFASAASHTVKVLVRAAAICIPSVVCGEEDKKGDFDKVRPWQLKTSNRINY